MGKKVVEMFSREQIRELAIATLSRNAVSRKGSFSSNTSAAKLANVRSRHALVEIEDIFKNCVFQLCEYPLSRSGVENLFGAYLAISVGLDSSDSFVFLKNIPDEYFEPAVSACANFFLFSKKTQRFNFGVAPNEMLLEYVNWVKIHGPKDLSEICESVLFYLNSTIR